MAKRATFTVLNDCTACGPVQMQCDRCGLRFVTDEVPVECPVCRKDAPPTDEPGYRYAVGASTSTQSPDSFLERWADWAGPDYPERPKCPTQPQEPTLPGGVLMQIATLEWRVDSLECRMRGLIDALRLRV